MQYLWLIALPVTALCFMAIAAHAAFMRSMMPPPMPDLSKLNTRASAPDPLAQKMRNPQESLWDKGETNA